MLNFNFDHTAAIAIFFFFNILCRVTVSEQQR